MKFLLALLLFSLPSNAENLTFVKEIISELSSLENTRELAVTELRQQNNRHVVGIKNAQRLMFELNLYLEKLKAFSEPPTDSISKALMSIYQQKITLLQEEIEILSPAAIESKLDQGRLDDLIERQRRVDEDLLALVPALTALISSDGRFTLTIAEKKDLIKLIKTRFGLKLIDEKNLTVQFANSLLIFLKQDLKCAGER